MKKQQGNHYQPRALSSAPISRVVTYIVYSRVRKTIITICCCKTISIPMDIVYGFILGWKRSRKEGICLLLPICQGRSNIFRYCIYSLLARFGGSILGILLLNVGRRCLGIVAVGGGIGPCSFSGLLDKGKRYTSHSVLLIPFLGFYGSSKKSVLQFTMELQCLYKSRVKAN